MGKLFGTFQQVDTEKNHHKEGTGLGLSISRQLVELMQGSIGVKSEYGKGSEFYFTIHQQIVEQSKAAQISQGRAALVIGNMKSQAANGMLEGLVKGYGLCFSSDLKALEQSKLPVFYFTDQYEMLSAEEIQKLAEAGAVVCGMQNPMAESDFPDEVLTMNKPLYSYNFCNLIEGRYGQDSGTEMKLDQNGDTSKEEAEGEALEFLAPEAWVLIVDDNEINCMVAEEMLKPLEMNIEIAVDGRQAVEMVRKKQYDLVFMDHFMPVMNGIEAAKEIRKLDEAYYQKLPIIALTANTAKEQQEEYLQAGMSDFLSKPIDMTEIYKLIRKWIPDKIKQGN